jgi:hypothetical protein
VKKSKQDLDRDLSYLLGIPQRKIADITAAYAEVLKQELLERGEVRIHGFGKLSIHFIPSGSKDMMGHPRQPLNCRVHFAKSPAFKAEIERYFHGKEKR